MLVAWRSQVQPDPDVADDGGPPVRDRLLTLVPVR
jgi:hypothetical protein